METAALLTFRLRGRLYAIDASAVLEIVPLPEIARIDEAPNFVAGMVNLRGHLVPIIDLNLRFGQTWQPNRPDQSVVILMRADQTVGVMVDEAVDVLDFPLEEAAPAPLVGLASSDPDSRFVQSVFKSGEQIVMRLHLQNLLGIAETLPDLECSQALMPAFVGANAEDTATFRERSRQLARPIEREETADQRPLAVVRIGEELFGIELRTIREFAELRNLTPVPCCPKHVVGQINLRGELVSVFDISAVLGLVPSRDRAEQWVVVIHDPSLAGGVLVDELMDVRYLDAADLKSIPRGFRDAAKEHIVGAAMHGTRMFSLIDLPALLMHGALTVNEIP